MNSGEQVWVKDKTGYIQGVVQCTSGDVVDVVILATGEERRLSAHDLFPRPEVFLSKADCCSLTHLDEANILYNLSRRYAMNDIYTMTASVLLAVNPHKSVPHLYTDEVRRAYCNLPSAHAQPPHPYALADAAFRQMLHDKKCQAIVISGESGSGKTETAKIVMGFLARRSRTGEEQATGLQRKILCGANPILESFGNATTVRNANSSRFGKYNMLCFNSVGNLMGATIDTYLLESSRVVTFAERERSYHVLYELMNHRELAKYNLNRNHDYRLLRQREASTTRDDVRGLKLLLEGFTHMNFSEDFVDNIFRLLAGIVHLCEVSFQDTDDTCELLNEANLSLAADLLGMDDANMSTKFTKREVIVKKKDRTSIYFVQRSAIQATATVQALMKALYKRLFDLLVTKMNDGLGGDRTSRHIGILDIYGFEQLEMNSFEQLCINLANERLQNFFVQHVLIAEQQCYVNEGLPWKNIQTPDCTLVVNAISSIMGLLDNQGILASKNQKADDRKFTEDVHRQLRHSRVVMAPKRGRGMDNLDAKEGFIIKHFAGEVTYATTGWLEKNNARLPTELECMIRDSTAPLVASLLDREGCIRACSSFTSVSKKYLKGSEELLRTLGTCDLHYIRCFKPNDNQKPNHFAGHVVLNQMIQSGTVELVKVMHNGYPHRCRFDELKERFLPLLPEDFHREDPRMFLDALMFLLGLNSDEWTLGTSLLFLKSGKLAALDALKDEELSDELVGKLRRYVTRKKLRRCLHAVTLCRWLQLYMKRARKNKLLGMLQHAVCIRVRLHHWLCRARWTLLQKRVDATCIKVRHTVKLLVYLHRWSKRARRRVRIEEYLTSFARIARLSGCLRAYQRRRARQIMSEKRARRARAQQLLHHVFRYVLLRMSLRQYATRRVEMLREERILVREYRFMSLSRHAMLMGKLSRYAQKRRTKTPSRPQLTLMALAWMAVYRNRWMRTLRHEKEKEREAEVTAWRHRVVRVSAFRKWTRLRTDRISYDAEARQMRRQAILTVHWRGWVRAHQDTFLSMRIEKTQNLLSALYYGTMAFIMLRRWIVKLRVEGQRRRRTKHLLRSLSRGAQLGVHLRHYMRKRHKSRLLTLWRVVLLRVWVMRATKIMRARKAFFRTVLLVFVMKRWIRQQQTRNGYIDPVYFDYNGVQSIVPCGVCEVSPAERLGTLFFRIVLLKIWARRLRRALVRRKQDAQAFLAKQNASPTQQLLTLFCRIVMLKVWVRRWWRAEMLRQNECVASTFHSRGVRARVFNCWKQQMLFAQQLKAHRVSGFINTLYRGTLLTVILRRYARTWTATRRKNKRMKIEHNLSLLARSVLLGCVLRRLCRKKRKQSNTETLWRMCSQYVMLTTVLRKWMRARCEHSADRAQYVQRECAVDIGTDRRASAITEDGDLGSAVGFSLQGSVSPGEDISASEEPSFDGEESEFNSSAVGFSLIGSTEFGHDLSRLSMRDNDLDSVVRSSLQGSIGPREEVYRTSFPKQECDVDCTLKSEPRISLVPGKKNDRSSLSERNHDLVSPEKSPLKNLVSPVAHVSVQRQAVEQRSPNVDFLTKSPLINSVSREGESPRRDPSLSKKISSFMHESPSITSPRRPSLISQSSSTTEPAAQSASFHEERSHAVFHHTPSPPVCAAKELPFPYSPGKKQPRALHPSSAGLSGSHQRLNTASRRNLSCSDMSPLRPISLTQKPSNNTFPYSPPLRPSSARLSLLTLLRTPREDSQSSSIISSHAQTVKNTHAALSSLTKSDDSVGSVLSTYFRRHVLLVCHLRRYARRTVPRLRRERAERRLSFICRMSLLFCYMRSFARRWKSRCVTRRESAETLITSFYRASLLFVTLRMWMRPRIARFRAQRSERFSCRPHTGISGGRSKQWSPKRKEDNTQLRYSASAVTRPLLATVWRSWCTYHKMNRFSRCRVLRFCYRTWCYSLADGIARSVTPRLSLSRVSSTQSPTFQPPSLIQCVPRCTSASQSSSPSPARPSRGLRLPASPLHPSVSSTPAPGCKLSLSPLPSRPLSLLSLPQCTALAWMRVVLLVVHMRRHITRYRATRASRSVRRLRYTVQFVVRARRWVSRARASLNVHKTPDLSSPKKTRLSSMFSPPLRLELPESTSPSKKLCSNIFSDSPENKDGARRRISSLSLFSETPRNSNSGRPARPWDIKSVISSGTPSWDVAKDKTSPPSASDLHDMLFLEHSNRSINTSSADRKCVNQTRKDSLSVNGVPSCDETVLRTRPLADRTNVLKKNGSTSLIRSTRTAKDSSTQPLPSSSRRATMTRKPPIPRVNVQTLRKKGPNSSTTSIASQAVTTQRTQSPKCVDKLVAKATHPQRVSYASRRNTSSFGSITKSSAERSAKAGTPTAAAPRQSSSKPTHRAVALRKASLVKPTPRTVPTTQLPVKESVKTRCPSSEATSKLTSARPTQPVMRQSLPPSRAGTPSRSDMPSRPGTPSRLGTPSRPGTPSRSDTSALGATQPNYALPTKTSLARMEITILDTKRVNNARNQLHTAREASADASRNRSLSNGRPAGRTPNSTGSDASARKPSMSRKHADVRDTKTVLDAATPVRNPSDTQQEREFGPTPPVAWRLAKSPLSRDQYRARIAAKEAQIVEQEAIAGVREERFKLTPLSALATKKTAPPTRPSWDDDVDVSGFGLLFTDPASGGRKKSIDI